MLNVIDFLERVGQDACLRHAHKAELETAMLNHGLTPEVRAALLEGDQHALEGALGFATNVCCMVHVPMREGQDDKNKPKDEERVAA